MTIYIGKYMSIFFYIFSSLMIFSSIGVVSSRNAIHSVLWLIFTLCNGAGLFVIMGAEFLAMTLIIVYVGAVAVLFLFVVMMLGTNIDSLKNNTKYSWFMSSVLLGFLILDLILVIFVSVNIEHFRAIPNYSLGDSMTNTAYIGSILYTDFILAFQISGLILFVAMIGCIILTLRLKDGVRRQKASIQLSRNKDNCLEITKNLSSNGIKGIKYE